MFFTQQDLPPATPYKYHVWKHLCLSLQASWRLFWNSPAAHTLMASYKKGNRPSYIRAAGHTTAIPLYESFCRKLGEALGKPVQTGEFGAEMKVDLLNHGPVTICMDTKNKE